MFGLGFIEILVIFLAVIVFVNPKDLPAFFRKLGRVYGQIKDFRNKSVGYFQEIERQIERQSKESADEQSATPNEKKPVPNHKNTEPLI